jgi:hypothetical protein
MRVIELRNYLIRDGMTRDFIRYFEEHFLFSQRGKGMHVLGQFEVVDDPNRFVWIRGFEDMAARLRGLSDFYAGSFWQARRSAVNAMVLSAYRDAEHLAAMRTGWPGGDPWRAVLGRESRAPLAAEVATLRLRPTARSLIRYTAERIA